MTELEEKLHVFVDKCMVGTQDFLTEKQQEEMTKRLHEEASAIGAPTVWEET